MTEPERAAIREYRKQGLGYKKIAMRTGVSLNTIKSFCKRKHSTKIEAEAPKVCLQCRRLITQTRGRKMKKFCSDKCRMEWWNKHPELVKRTAVYEFTCQTCGTTFTAYGNAHRKYCCRECYLIGGGGGSGMNIVKQTGPANTASYPDSS